MSGTELARRILHNLTHGGTRNVRKDYVEHLTSKSIAFLKNYESGFFGIRAESGILRDSTFEMVERIYHMLEPYVVQFNDAVGSGRLSIAATPPDENLEKSEGEWPFRPPQEMSFYRARFTTSSLSLVIRGFDDRVEFFVLPVELIMRQSNVEDDYGALMTYAARMESGKVEWEVEDKPLTDDRFERYCLLMLDYFVKLNQEVMVGELLEEQLVAAS